jgi:hypothetical protein
LKVPERKNPKNEDYQGKLFDIPKTRLKLKVVYVSALVAKYFDGFHKR